MSKNKPLSTRLRARLAYGEQHTLSKSYVNCQSARVQKQIEQLSEADKVTWFAGHHNGANALARAERFRTAELDKLFCECVALLTEIDGAVDDKNSEFWANEFRRLLFRIEAELNDTLRETLAATEVRLAKLSEGT